MPKTFSSFFFWLASTLVVTLLAGTLDDFEDGIKTGWSDFAPSFGTVVEMAAGQYWFQVPAQAGPPIFAASAKVAETFTLKDGQTIEFRVDVVSAEGPDAFAVLAWVPVSQPLSAMAGYFIAKSGREIRVGKAIHKYFYRGTPAPPLKQENVTLVLSLTGSGGNIQVNAKVLDQEGNHEVLFDKTFVDTPGIDPLSAGTDAPAEPWAGKGNFALMAYSELEDGGINPREVWFDNAIVSTPQPLCLVPWFHDVELTNTASFLTDLQAVNFRVSDNRPLWPSSGFAAPIDGPFGMVAMGSDIESEGKTLYVSAAGLFQVNTNYTIHLLAVYASASNTMTLHFDTFLPSCPVIELEDYNFGGGQFFDVPEPTAEGTGPWDNAYGRRAGVVEVDFHVSPKDRTNSLYRPQDPVSTRRSVDYLRAKFPPPGLAEGGIFDYDIYRMAEGDTLTYTRTFAETVYAVYLREALVNIDQAETVLERVVGPPGPSQTTTVLGHFFGRNSGFEYRNVPLTDALEKPVSVVLSGVETLRLRQLTSAPGDGSIYQNYLVFAPLVNERPILESAPNVSGPFQPEWTSVRDSEQKTVTAQRPKTSQRFYRINYELPVTIRKISIEGDNLIFQYQLVR